MSTSGAYISVVKRGPFGPQRERLLAQARWLLQHANDPGLVNVYTVLEDGYEMELLESHNQVHALQIVELLESNVWCHPTTAAFNPDAFAAYLVSLPHGELLLDWAATLSLSEDYCDTHGDPTFENIMRRGTQLVLIDPLPDRVSSGQLPSIKTLDLGKVMQSTIGYEHVKRGYYESFEDLTLLDDHWYRGVVPPAEWEHVRFFAALHIARFIPYQTSELAMLWDDWFPRILKRLQEG